MKKYASPEHRETILPSIGVVLASAPSFFFKFSSVFLRFKSRARKAGNIFYKELRRQGIDQETAKALTGEYKKVSHLRQYLSFQ